VAQRTPQDSEPEFVGLLGLGLDNEDEHKRVTTGENFILVGGSDRTHDRMIDTAVYVNDWLLKRGKTLHEATPDELAELIREASLRRR
jgi:hypothetical protein